MNIPQPPAHLTTTGEIQQWAIEQARNKGWMVCSQPAHNVPNPYAAIVIAWPEGRNTNWARAMTIVDGQAQTEFYQSPKGKPLMDDKRISTKLKAFRLNTGNIAPEDIS